MGSARKANTAAHRSTSLVVVAFALLLVGAAAAGAAALRTPLGGPGDVPADVAGRPAMGPEEIPAEVVTPTRAGDRSVASFAEFLAEIRGLGDGTPAPRPPDLDGLVARTARPSKVSSRWRR